MSTPAHSLRKVSLLLNCLDETSAAKLLAALPAESAEALRGSVRSTRIGSAQERHDVLREFLGAEAETSDDRLSGIELDVSLTDRLADANVAGQRDDCWPEEEASWRFLVQMDRVQLARRLQQESPQVAAVVLAQLPPEHAARVLDQMTRPMRQAAIQRLTHLEDQDPLILDAIRQVLEEETPRPLPPAPPQPSAAPPSGWQTAQAIVAASSPGLRQELQQHLAGLREQVSRPARDLRSEDDDVDPFGDPLLSDREMSGSAVAGSRFDAPQESPRSRAEETAWAPPWLRLFAEQPNPWHFERGRKGHDQVG